MPSNSTRPLLALIVLLLTLFAPLVHAQFSFLKPKAEAPTAAAETDTVDPRARAEAQLAEARRQQEAARSEQDLGSDAQSLVVSDRRGEGFIMG